MNLDQLVTKYNGQYKDMGGSANAMYQCVDYEDVREIKMSELKRTFEEIEVVPGHQPRTESPQFLANKKRLIEDGHDSCWVCGTKDQIQTHHYGLEWSLFGDVDPVQLQDFLLEWDIYGYSKVLKAQPITDPDDIRNLVQLCEKHHIAKFTGIHLMTFPLWISQKVCKTDPIITGGK